MIVNIIQNLPIHKKAKEVFAFLIRAISEIKKPLIRTLAGESISKDFIDTSKYSSPQALVNRIRRFLNSHKWDYIKVQLALAKSILARLKTRKRIKIHVLVDFTSLKDKWRILSFAVPIGGMALSILNIPVSINAFSNLEWNSEVDFIIYAISLLIPILPKGTVFTFDREFTFPKLIEFLKDNGMYYVIRLKKTVYVDGKAITELSPGIYENVRVHKTITNVYLEGYLTIDNKRDFYAYMTNLPAKYLSWELYKERMKIEEKFRDEKNELNLKLLSYIEKSEVLGRWLTIYLAVLFIVYLTSKIEKEDHRIELIKQELEAGIISFIRYGLRVIEIYKVKLRVSNGGSLVLMIEGDKK